MTALEIGRLTATVHLPPDAGGVADRVDRLLHAAASGPLDAAMRAAEVPDGLWCLRRVDAPVRLDLDRGDLALAEAWAAAMSAAVARALATRGPDVVRYRCAADAVLDLVCEVAAGRSGRAWAWRAAGMLRPGDPDPAGRPGATVLAVLDRHRSAAAGAVVAATAASGLAALHRAWGPAGWAALARLVDGVGGDPPPAAGAVADPYEPAALLLAGRLVAASRFAAAVQATQVRPDAATVAAWARIVVAEVDATAGRRPSGQAVLAGVTAMLAAEPLPQPSVRLTPSDGRVRPSAVDAQPDAGRTIPGPGPVPAAPTPGGSRDPVAPPRLATRTSADPASSHPPAARQADDTDPAHPTAWAGVLFLLTTAEEACVPGPLGPHPDLAGRPLPWVLRQVAAALGAPPGDPVAAAFAGADPALPDPWRSDPATPAEAAAVAGLTRRWAAVTLATLVPTADEDEDRLRAVLHRPGLIRWSPGWIELEMPLDTVDLDVRRAGLDLDPGWVPWLGAVVGYRYG